MNIYELEHILKKKANDSAEDLIRYALLEALAPIEDFSFAIDILREQYSKYNDFRIAVLISFWMSTWENYKPNDFLECLNEFLLNGSNQQKAIIYYLNAYDIFMRSRQWHKQNEYVDFLKKSVDLSEKFVYNFYRLAQVSDKETAKKLMEKAFSNVEKVNNEEECRNMRMENFLDFEVFLQEYILGTELSEPNFATLQDFHSAL